MTDRPEKKTRGPYKKAPKEEKVYECTCCNYDSTVKANYQRHMKSADHFKNLEVATLASKAEQLQDQALELKGAVQEEANVVKDIEAELEEMKQRMAELEAAHVALKQELREKDIILRGKDETIAALQQAVEVMGRQGPVVAAAPQNTIVKESKDEQAARMVEKAAAKAKKEIPEQIADIKKKLNTADWVKSGLFALKAQEYLGEYETIYPEVKEYIDYMKLVYPYVILDDATLRMANATTDPYQFEKISVYDKNRYMHVDQKQYKLDENGEKMISKEYIAMQRYLKERKLIA
jgi:hypothetical protein